MSKLDQTLQGEVDRGGVLRGYGVSGVVGLQSAGCVYERCKMRYRQVFQVFDSDIWGE